MNLDSSLQLLLDQIAAITRMEAGKLCVIREGPTGPYYNHQCYEAGRNVSRYVPAAKDKVFEKRDYPKGYFADSVKVAKNEFRVGNLFEVVLSQAFREELKVYPSKIFRR